MANEPEGLLTAPHEEAPTVPHATEQLGAQAIEGVIKTNNAVAALARGPVRNIISPQVANSHLITI